MAVIRVDRLERERKKTLEGRLKTLERTIRKLVPKFSCTTPSPLEFAARIPAILELMDSPTDEFEEEQLEKVVRDTVPTYIEKRLADARSYFTDLIKADLELELPDGVDPLTLAIGTYFSCTYCELSHSFPAILSHGCRLRRDVLNEASGEFLGYVVRSLYTGQRVWSQTAFVTHAKRLAEYVRTYGLDPLRATAAEMDASDVRLQCATHGRNSSRPDRAIYTWRLAVSCFRRWEWGEADCSLLCV